MALKDGDELTYLMQYDPDMKNIVLQISASSPMSPSEYLLALIDFIESNEKTVDDLFKGGHDFLIEKH